ncbi:uncharacterized protein LOC142817355 [Rhipicephalus microplus]|uniref:uncharacterized protein LOC142817355 n=1 Tax=Rhipicephalus microplus TaxID=6941 RepID=UPI003F6B9AEF
MLFFVLSIALVCSNLVAASVQSPTLTSCSSAQSVKLSGVSITDAQIGKTMKVNFSMIITTQLASSPTLKITIKTSSGSTVPCINNVGSCTYKLCGGTTSLEQEFGMPWNNKCPINPITVQQSITANLDPLIQLLIGTAPTTLTIQIAILNGGVTVGCQSFKVNIAAA